MAKKHNNWMTILQAVLTALASLFGSLKIKDTSASDEASSDAE